MNRTVSTLAAQRLAAWFSRKPAFALMGEYSSGKSALLNFLLGHPLLPTKVTATDLPAVWITEGKSLKLSGLAYDGTIDELGLEDLQAARAMQYLLIRIETTAEILKRTDIIDTPGISDPRMSTEIVEEIARYSDFAIWCSPMNQAWRQTERAFWRACPDRLKELSVLALTRVDMMRSATDIDKVMKRCEAEAGAEFAAIVAVSAPLAVTARDLPPGPERDSLQARSGVFKLLAAVMSSVSDAETLCQDRPDLPDPVEAPVSHHSTEGRMGEVRELRKRRVEQPKVEVSSLSIPELVSALSTLRTEAKDFSRNEHILATIGHLFSQVSGDKALTAEHRDVLVRALTVGTEPTRDIARCLKQVEHEVEDFADGPWCDLGT